MTFDTPTTPSSHAWDLFDAALRAASPRVDARARQSTCAHTAYVTHDALLEYCAQCGVEKRRTLLAEREWGAGAGDSRCQTRKGTRGSIDEELHYLGFDDDIVSRAEKIYTQVASGIGGTSHRAIIFACVFNAFKLANAPQNCDTLRDVFGLDRRAALRGLKIINMHAPKTSEIRVKYITPAQFVHDMMSHFGATEAEEQEVLALYELVKKRSLSLSRSRPQSIASALVYIFLSTGRKDFDVKLFLEKAMLSELTVSKIAREIVRVLGAISNEA